MISIVRTVDARTGGDAVEMRDGTIRLRFNYLPHGGDATVYLRRPAGEAGR